MTLYSQGIARAQEASIAIGGNLVPVFTLAGSQNLPLPTVPSSTLTAPHANKVWLLQFFHHMDDAPSGFILFDLQEGASSLASHADARPIGSGTTTWWDGAPLYGPTYFYLEGTPTIQGMVTNNTSQVVTTWPNTPVSADSFLSMFRQDITVSPGSVSNPSNCAASAFYRNGDILSLRYDSTTGNVFIDQFRNGIFLQTIIVDNVASAPTLKDLIIAPGNGNVLALYNDMIKSVNRDDDSDVSTLLDLNLDGYDARAMCYDGTFVYLLIAQDWDFGVGHPLGIQQVPAMMRINASSGAIVPIAGNDTWLMTNRHTKVTSEEQMFQLIGDVFVFNTDLLTQIYTTIMGFTLVPTIQSELTEVINVTDSFSEVGFKVNKLAVISDTDTVAAGTDGSTNAVGKHSNGTFYNAGTAPNEGLDVQVDPDGDHVWISSSQGLFKFTIAGTLVTEDSMDCIGPPSGLGAASDRAHTFFSGEGVNQVVDAGESQLAHFHFYEYGPDDPPFVDQSGIDVTSLPLRRFDSWAFSLTVSYCSTPVATGSGTVTIQIRKDGDVIATASRVHNTGPNLIGTLQIVQNFPGLALEAGNYEAFIINETDRNISIAGSALTGTPQHVDLSFATNGNYQLPADYDVCWDKFVVVNCQEQAQAFVDMVGRGSMASTVDAHQVFPGLARVPKLGTTQDLFTRTTPP